MKTLFHELRTALLLTALLAVLLGGVYPALVWGAAQLLFPSAANGSLVRDPDGTLRGSALLAQNFTGERYFHPRPSAAGAGYDAAASSGSNLGPTSRKLADAIATDVAAYRARHQLPAGSAVPADAVTRSGSGLDPDISPANAALQADRVARARGLPPERIRALIEQHAASPDWGVFGQARINVFLLNRALDGLPR
jgi:K+-transporting ATPase ATPase C chain